MINQAKKLKLTSIKEDGPSNPSLSVSHLWASPWKSFRWSLRFTGTWPISTNMLEHHWIHKESSHNFVLHKGGPGKMRTARPFQWPKLLPIRKNYNCFKAVKHWLGDVQSKWRDEDTTCTTVLLICHRERVWESASSVDSVAWPVSLKYHISSGFAHGLNY